MDVLIRKPLLRVVLAIIWMMLSDSYELGSFVAGFIMATLVLWAFPAPINTLAKRPFQGFGGFIKWFGKSFYLLGYFIWQVIVANWQVVRLALSPKIDIKPGIIRMGLTGRTPGQITLLSAMISLTPGTLVMDVSKENDAIFIHCIDATDEGEALRVPYRFEAMVMEVIPG